MPSVIVTKNINAALETVWASIDDFANIQKFNPNLARSFLINGSQATGLGATRQCDLSDGKNFIRERVVGYVPNERFEVDIYDGTMPLKTARADFTLKRLGPMRTALTMTMFFQPKMGALGLLMVPMMKPQLRKAMSALLEGNRAYVEDGVVLKAA